MSSTTLDLGPVRIVPKGTYSATATYELLNMVSYNGSSWLMKASSYTVGTTPVEGATWTLLAQKGETGATGAAGTNGQDGADGSDATVPIATASVLGKVSIGSGLEVTSAGALSISSANQTTLSDAATLLTDVSINAGALKVVRSDNAGKISSGYLPVATTAALGGVKASTLVPVNSSTGAMSVALGSYGSTVTGSTVVANTSVSCPTLILNGWTVTVSS